MSEDLDDARWGDYPDFTYEELHNASVEFHLFDGIGWCSGFGILIAYTNLEGRMRFETHSDPTSFLAYHFFELGHAASFCLERHENPDLAAFHLKSNA
jgi:hypothetical protein